MLNQDSLSQLRQLKQTLHDQTERTEATIRGSRGRYGFAQLDDGRSVFLPPDEMDKVFPGDRVYLAIHQDAKGKFSGELEKLIDSPLGEFTGRYVIRGQGHFVEPDVAQFSKLLFIPPSERSKAKEGDYMRCKVSRHPWRDRRSQAKILKNLGDAQTPGIEAAYICEKFQLSADWPESLDKEPSNDTRHERKDLLDLPFITIDAAETRDVDDALYAEALEQGGWRLIVAIADPSAYIEAGTELDQLAQARASTAYLPGNVIPMLPEEISNNACSLLAEYDRAVLACEMQISDGGEILDYRFFDAMIRSQNKLRYRDVAAHLKGDMHLPEPSLTVLHAIAQALNGYRREHHIVMEDKPDYRFILNEDKKIDTILRMDRNDAHRLVEECMLAANHCVADYLKDASGAFIVHPGLRQDRIDNAKQLIKDHLPALADTDITSLEGFVALHKAAEAKQAEDPSLPLADIIGRMQERSRLSSSHGAHLGLGTSGYATFTSPLRKFSDMLNHRSIRAKLEGERSEALDETSLEALQAKLDDVRQASQQMERWLSAEFLSRQDKDAVHQGEIQHLMSSGFVVKLSDSGIEGFVDSRDLDGKHSFDPAYLTLSRGDSRYQLRQAVKVKVKHIDVWKGRVEFTLEQTPAAAEASAAE